MSQISIVNSNNKSEVMDSLEELLSSYNESKQNNVEDNETIRALLKWRNNVFNTPQKHTFYLIPFSIWPFCVFISALTTVVGFVMYLHSYQYGLLVFLVGMLGLIGVFIFWCADVVSEALVFSIHSNKLQSGLSYGVILFIVSEVMFFFAFFWAFFSSSLSPSIWIGGEWPPVGINAINPFGVPLGNTIILVVSGLTITWSHALISKNNIEESMIALLVTICLALLFLFWQYIEYSTAQFHINDGVYGSVFYMTTGFHGFHVIIGTIWLIVCLFRMWNDHFTASKHFGFEAAIWYWHFVDIVWIFLFIFVYCWGNSIISFLPEPILNFLSNFLSK